MKDSPEHLQSLLTEAYESIVAGQAFRPRRDEDLAQLERFGFVNLNGLVELDETTELLDADEISRQLKDETTRRVDGVEICGCIGSTNDELLRRAQLSSIDGAVLMAEVQIAGRGRRGRTWETPFGKNIAMSLGVAFDKPASEVASLSLVVGVSVAQALSDIGVGGASLKWPNDILIQRAKAGGILTELVSASRPVEVVIGIGINVGGAEVIRDKVDYPVADVCDWVAGAVRNRLAAEVINRVRDNCVTFERSGFEAFQIEWTELDAYRNMRVVASSQQERIEGIDIGVASDGKLLIRDDGGNIRSVIGGDVTLRDVV